MQKECKTILSKDYLTKGMMSRAVLHGTLEDMQQLFDLGCQDVDSAAELISGKLWTPVQWAVYTKDLEKLKWLIEHGADIECRFQGKSLLYYASKHSSKEIVDFLKSIGCSFW